MLFINKRRNNSKNHLHHENLFETLDTSKPQEDFKKEEKNVNAIPNNPSSKGKNSVEQRVQKMNYISGNLNKK